jgi:diguanylate cyclase (GGDEF)-like protein
MDGECRSDRIEERKLFIEKATEMPRWALIGVCTVLTVGIALVDYWTGQELYANGAYLLPVALIAWAFGAWAGVGMSLLSVATWLVADYGVASHPGGVAMPYWNAFALLGFFVTFAVLLARLRKSIDHERELSRTDPLTGSCNTRCFYEQAGKELERSRRYGHSVSLAFLDLDNFKEVNDTFGHAAGDRVLRAVTDSLERNVRSSDIVSRLGGDEFCVLFPETGVEEALTAVNKLRREAEGSVPEPYRNIPGFSIGLVTYRRTPDSVEEMVQAADKLMYEVKTSGKNNVAHAVFD